MLQASKGREERLELENAYNQKLQEVKIKNDQLLKTSQMLAKEELDLESVDKKLQLAAQQWEQLQDQVQVIH